MNVMSLFAGIGGFDLAAEHMGWNTKVQVEIDEWCRKVLAKNFPNAIRYDDIKTFDGTPYRNTVDLVCGGFPCQPFSHAGKRKGNDDDRALWPEMLRVIREVAPRWVVGENVSGLLTQSNGLVLESLLVDLEAEGYTVWTYTLPACAVNAPHRRNRVWIVAHRDDRQRKSAEQQLRTGWDTVGAGGNTIADREELQQREPAVRKLWPESAERPTADANGGRGPTVNNLQPGQSDLTRGTTADAPINGRPAGRKRTGREAGSNPVGGGIGSTLGNATGGRRDEPTLTQPGQHNQPTGTTGRSDSHADATNPNGTGREEFNAPGLAARPGHRTGGHSQDWSDWPTQPPLCPGNDGVSTGLVRRNNVIKAAGNAVVWQVAYQIFKAIQQIDNDFNHITVT